VSDTAEGQGRDELGGTVAHHGVHQCPRLHHLAGQVQGFVTSDAAGHSQDYAFIL